MPKLATMVAVAACLLLGVTTITGAMASQSEFPNHHGPIGARQTPSDLAITSPKPGDDWTPGQRTISWTGSNPPMFSIGLVNQAKGTNLAVASNVNAAAGSITYSLDSLPEGPGWRVVFYDVGNIDQVYSSSGEFSINKDSSSKASPTSLPGSLSNVTKATNATNSTMSSSSSATSAPMPTSSGSPNAASTLSLRSRRGQALLETLFGATGLRRRSLVFVDPKTSHPHQPRPWTNVLPSTPSFHHDQDDKDGAAVLSPLLQKVLLPALEQPLLLVGSLAVNLVVVAFWA